MSLIVDNISKIYSSVQAVRNLSMQVEEGTIFGFLGPNGAGKTTTIRMILDIIRPDSGEITWKGKNVGTVPRSLWGYLPEERGLYPKMTVEDQLLFFGQLYNMPKDHVKKEMEEWLERFQITSHRKKRVEELSKGNQQKVQILATILHNPTILLMDEPLSGLDPVNGAMLKDAFLELHRRGKTIIFSTHQMEQVEELCHSIVIINKGQVMVSGTVQQVKRQKGRKLVRLALNDDREVRWLDTMPGVDVKARRQDYVEVSLVSDVSPDDILQAALRHGGQITRFELSDPSLNDIFIEQVRGISMPDERVLA